MFANSEEATRIGRQMVEERLAACVNILGPCCSIYRWRGEVETAEEIPAIFKTSEAHGDALIARIASLHSYEIPCVAVCRSTNCSLTMPTGSSAASARSRIGTVINPHWSDVGETPILAPCS